MEAKLRLFHTL